MAVGKRAARSPFYRDVGPWDSSGLTLSVGLGTPVRLDGQDNAGEAIGPCSRVEPRRAHVTYAEAMPGDRVRMARTGHELCCPSILIRRDIAGRKAEPLLYCGHLA